MNSTSPKIAKLVKVPLRDVWKHEALDFTQWLALEENIQTLSEELGIDFFEMQTEVNVGSFHVDILAEDSNGDKVVIENQLEATNHDHLGKLITYASGLGAKTAIWIVKKPKEEHHQAIDWLNENTTQDAHFFLIELEAWRIGDSLPAPKFNIIARPNGWAKLIKQAGSSDVKITDTKLQQQEFWNKFKDYASEHSKNIRSWQKPLFQHWYNIAIGSSRANIAVSINSKDELLTTEIHIPNDKDLFNILFDKKDEIETKIGHPLEWMELPDRKKAKIAVIRSGNALDLNQQDECIEWFTVETDLFAKVFPKYIK